jgi:hypothetical protein
MENLAPRLAKHSRTARFGLINGDVDKPRRSRCLHSRSRFGQTLGIPQRYRPHWPTAETLVKSQALLARLPSALSGADLAVAIQGIARDLSLHSGENRWRQARACRPIISLRSGGLELVALRQTANLPALRRSTRKAGARGLARHAEGAAILSVSRKKAHTDTHPIRTRIPRKPIREVAREHAARHERELRWDAVQEDSLA